MQGLLAWLNRRIRGDGRTGSTHERNSPDLAVIISEYNRGWVLETICRQIEAHWPASVEFVWTRRNRKITAPIPKARVYWFSHFQLLCTALNQNPDIRHGQLMVWYTHPSKPEISKEKLVDALNVCHAVIFACRLHRNAMVEAGVRPDICHVVLGGAERKYVGFASAYYERKNPELMEALIRSMPEEDFLLVGPKADSMETTERMWTRYSGFEQLAALPNFTYVEAEYRDYPKYYNQMKVFLSLSRLEGGPISLIEAMMCGCYVIATDTGFARDIFERSECGKCISTEVNLEQLHREIRARRPIEKPQQITWRHFAGQMYALSL